MTGWIKNHFIPGEHNEHRPHVLRTPAIRAILGAVVMVEVLFLIQALVILPNFAYFGAVITGVMTTETNVDRQANNLPALKANPLLEEAARRKAADMAARGYFAHVAPDGTSPWKWIKEVGYYYVSAGENLAINFVDSKDVTDAWMNSPLHRANMLSEKFTEVGIGTAEGTYQGKQTTFVVQYFGKPYDLELARIAAQVASATPIALAPVATPTSKVIAPKPSVAKKTVTKPVVAAVPTTTVAAVAPTTTLPMAILDSAIENPPATELLTYESHIPEKADIVVLGLETTVTEGEVMQTESGIFSTMLANPRRTMTGALLALAGMLIIALLINVLARIRMQHFDLTTNGLALVAIVLFVILANDFLSFKDLAVF
jgi:Cysteine-rich secretory protein family